MTDPARAKAVVILSTKSSGSSPLQRRVTAITGARHVDHTRHFEHETLYWNKATSVLGLPQEPVPDFEIPIPREQARRDLEDLLTANVPGYEIPSDDETLVFDGWRALCERYRPVFLEKSPHHLHVWSSLELMASCDERCPGVEMQYVGLVRNPMDCLHSQWTRYYSAPEVMQHHWRIAYENLLRLRDMLGEDRVLIVRYEDLTRGDEILLPLFRFVGREPEASSGAERIDRRSIAKWRSDRLFGFRLAPEVVALAERLGYDPEELRNDANPLWPLWRRGRRLAGQAYRAAVPLRRQMRLQRALRRVRGGGASQSST